uniref:Uncharacterized protein n=1 Tax=Setaria italica TaxID=4555 RepID=K3ZFP6_SETIT
MKLQGIHIIQPYAQLALQVTNSVHNTKANVPTLVAGAPLEVRR